MLILLYVDTFAEDASRFSASQVNILTLPGETVTVSFDMQEVCTGAVGAQATCVVKEKNSLGTVVSFTETFSAVRTPIFTVTSTSGSARQARSASSAVMALAVAVVYIAIL